ncbi:MAG: hypothetical protein M1821_005013 [Bathelium mastoideum]|nr:MAG: hypothetical protein M1821_005013 [Bathelium mastoideum]
MAKSGRMGEISHLKGLHRVVTRQGILDSAMSQQGVPGAPHVGSRSESITAAAFMPGHKTRAVSVGIDGKCRLIDFERGVTILRTWKTGAPATCLSVLSSKSSPRARGNTQIDRPIEPKTRSRAGAQDHVPMSEAIQTDNVLAVGRVDGKVMLFDSIGCLMTEKDADPHGGRVIDVVWIKGSAPKSSYDACDNSGVLGQRIDIPELEDWKAVERNVRPHQRAATSTGNKRKLSELIPVADDTLGQGQEADGKHLLKSPTASKEATAPTSKYMDLFSPVKNMSYHSPERNVAEPVTKPRTRSVTFHESKPDIPLSGSTSYSTALICSPQKNESSGLPEPVISASHNDGRTASIQLDTARQSLMHGAKSFRRIPESTKDGSSLCSSRSIHSDSSTKSSDCSNILADLKRAGGHDSNKGNGIALFAPYMKPVPKPAVREGKGKGRENPLRYPIDGAIDDDAKLNITSAESSSNNSPQNSTFNPDIWLDSASPVKFARPRRRARPSHSKLRQAVSFPHPSTQSQLPHPPDPNSPTSPLLHQRTFSPSIDSDICAGAGDLHDEDNEARFGTALGCQNAIEYGSTSPRRSSLSQVKELLSPRRRRDRAGAKEQAKEVEAGNKVEMGKSRAGTLEIEEQREEREEEMEETVGAGMGDRKRVGRLALGNITGNEIPRLEEEEATGLKTEAGKRRDSLGEKIGIQAFGSKGRGRAGKKPIKGKTNEVQPEHRCHCTECPALRRELQELRDEITQLRQEILIRKKNGY